MNQYINIIIVGDFNFSNIQWSQDVVTANSPIETEFVSLLSENRIIQLLVKEPTRFRSSQTPSLLDLVIVSDKSLVSSLEIQNPIGISDHTVIKFKLEFILYPDPCHSLIAISKTNYDSINKKLTNTNWEFLNSLTVQDQWTAFVEVISSCATENSCTFVKDINSTKPWIVGDLLKKVKFKKYFGKSLNSIQQSTIICPTVNFRIR